MATFDYRHLGDQQFLQPEISSELTALIENSKNGFLKAIVKDVISDPIEWLDTAIDEAGKTNRDVLINLYQKSNEELNVSDIINDNMIHMIPRNSILCYVPEGKGSNSISGHSIIAFPFFSSHFNLPIKPGEYVWLFVESNYFDASQPEFYWMNRVSLPRQIEDPNFAYLPKTSDIHPTLKKMSFNNNVPSKEDRETFYALEAVNRDNNMLGVEKISDIISSAYAFKKEFTGEPVPEINKECGDLLLQGSNNSAIHLTTEKFKEFNFGTAGDPEQNKATNNQVANHVSNFRKPFSGALDLFVGHAKNRISDFERFDASAAIIKDNDMNIAKINLSENHQSHEWYVRDKLIDNDVALSGPIPRDVYSRIYMTMNGDIDKNFEIPSQVTNDIKLFEHKTGPSIASYSNHVRSFAEITNRMAVVGKPNDDPEVNKFGMIEISEKGEITLQAGSFEKGAKIILRPNGNIILKPGPNGLLHLGGDESDTTLSVCGVPTNIDAENGTATPESIKSSLGGVLFRTDEPAGSLTPNIESLITTFVGTAVDPTKLPAASATYASSLTTAQGGLSNDGTASSKVVIKA